MPIDPICKTKVQEDTSYSMDYAGKKYRFCSSECKDKFGIVEKRVVRLKRSIAEKEKISFGKLRKEIIKPGICTLCGACTASCDSIVIKNEQPKLVDKCTACGLCYNQCPRTITTETGLVGKLRNAYCAKSALSGMKGQDGGVVTAMLGYALDAGLIDCAIVTTKSEEEPWKPVPIVAKTYEDILEGSGSIYSHSMTLKPLMDAVKEGMRSIAFVGPSCNIDAVTKMQKSPQGFLHHFMRANILKMGLFCMDTFYYEGIREFIESRNMNLADIESMKIRKGKFEFQTPEELRVFPLEEFDQYRSSSCKYCTDMAAENADISFGGVGTAQGWTTVLARSGIGYEIFNEAVDNGYIDARLLEEKEMKNALNLAKMKKIQMYSIHRRENK
ncbi:Coenzyme F420 hydrogenase/dehydrogenase, beta subunit C-terminal domain [Methanolobus bombayensis]|uniref:Coenzyme F420 hydrogenase/dehydrogenase, beta subunit C-terminal domain n=1 Tax=Methanolobus bombayensis TaxID=38023 RepID=UPI001AE267C3|nr:Coenzyme F420 hydrogenase/dehydrogenase, beta subunit C-terminal domain [Methanolobus bombayensis]MBP1909780.1 coenzyme F420 hydrogenase subunit beta [Methanolobus bombayensis]